MGSWQLPIHHLNYLRIPKSVPFHSCSAPLTHTHMFVHMHTHTRAPVTHSQTFMHMPTHPDTPKHTHGPTLFFHSLGIISWMNYSWQVQILKSTWNLYFSLSGTTVAFITLGSWGASRATLRDSYIIRLSLHFSFPKFLFFKRAVSFISILYTRY